MSIPSEDLTAWDAQRAADREAEELRQWAQSRLGGAVQQATPTEEPENPTPQLQDPSAPAPPQGEGVSAGDVAKDVGRGILAAPREVAGGIFDALKESAQFVQEVQGTQGMTSPAAEALPDVPDSGTVTGGMVRGVSQFLTGFVGAGKLKPLQALAKMGKAGAIANPILRGALADFTVLDPQEERLANLVSEHSELAKPVSDYLAAQPDDSAAEGRFKNALEGLVLGGLTDTFMRGVRAVRSMRAAKAAAGLDQPGVREAVEAVEAERSLMTQRLGDPDAPAIQIQSPIDAPDQPGKVFINWGPIQGPDELKQVIQDLADARAGNIDTARRGVRSWETTRATAAQLDAWKVLQERRIGEPLNSDQTVAVRELWIRSGERLRELMHAVNKNGGELDEIAFRRQLQLHYMIQEQVIPARTETARAFNAWAIPVGDSPAFAGQMEQLRVLAQADSGTTKDIARRLAALDAAGWEREADAFIEATALARGAAAVRQAWYGGLLSNPKTLVRNLVGTASQLLLEVPETKVANYLSRISGDHIIPDGEASQRLWGMMQGYRDAWTVMAKSRQVFETALEQVQDDPEAVRHLFAEDARQAFDSGVMEAQGQVRPFEMNRGGAFERLGEGRGTIPGLFFSFLETATTASTRAMQRTDELFKGMAFNAEMRAQAYRQAHSELQSGAITKEAFPDRLAEIMSSPSDYMRLASRTHAELATFTNAPIDTKTWQFVRSWHNVPVFGDITLPFARTPYNIATQVNQRTPLSFFMRSWNDDIKAGGPRARQAWSKFVVGNGILLTVADFAIEGQITGEGPTDPKEGATLERTGWKPWSKRVETEDGGAVYIDYRSLGSIGPLIQLAANTVDILKAKDLEDAEQQSKVEQLVIATSMAIAAQVPNQSFMTGAADFFDAMSDPQRYGEKWWKNLAKTAVVPRGVAQVERVLDPTQRIAWGIADGIRSDMPGMSAGLAPMRDRWGRVKMSGSGYGPLYDMLSPFNVSKEKAEPIDVELQRLEYWPSLPARTLNMNGAEVYLNPTQWSRLLELSGNGTKIDGQGLLDTLNALVTGKSEDSETYQELTDGPEGSKALMVERIMRGFDQAARFELIEEYPELRAELQRKMMERAQRRDPEAVQ